MIDANGLYTLPVPAPFLGLNAFGFSLAGYRVMAKIDPRPVPDDWKRYVLNGKRTFRGFFVDFEHSLEFSRAIQMAVRAEDRDLARANREQS
jgi:hypothetical protein